MRLPETLKWKIKGSSIINTRTTQKEIRYKTQNRTSLRLLDQGMLPMAQIVSPRLGNHWQYVTHVFSQTHRLRQVLGTQSFFLILSHSFATAVRVPAASSETCGPCCAPEHLHCICRAATRSSNIANHRRNRTLEYGGWKHGF